MSTLNDVPAELKHIQPYIQRSQEIHTIDPVISYFCKYYAARLAITSPASPTTQPYISHLLTILEQEKTQLQQTSQMQNDQIAAQHCTMFALKIFAKADSEDRLGGAGKSTARGFIVASQFMQIVAAFGEPLPGGLEEKIKYAKWRAAEILRAIREGRTPEPPAMQEEEEKELLSALPVSSPVVLPEMSSPQIASPQMASPPPPPIASPQLQQQQQWSGYAQDQPTPFDTLPSVPQSAVSAAVPQGPPLQSTAAQGPQTRPNNSPHINTPMMLPAASAATFIPVPASRLPAIAPSAMDDGEMLDPTVTKNAQKHARWAISALEYDDVHTAIDNLQKAIAILRPYQK
ncbi:hypothetical protein LPJ66_000216 [Kickxella alabastrina]|uniref:Uncharacterized protein n=1 Tax=Kickxella alabastrina TaxID=61397 RepID=A0ACC1IX23_9FUNG|nr:hypothetical protein LPJ66_000216 [Kickxella alabastrina]